MSIFLYLEHRFMPSLPATHRHETDCKNTRRVI
nr:MAG TPA: hypothetical protein [Caudoviricetes sp.]